MSIYKEIWKPITEYEGLYEASTFGRIRSLDRKVKCKIGFRTHKGKILTPIDNGIGYLLVNLSKNNKVKMFLIHRIVFKTFNPKIDISIINEVNHKDLNKSNNRLDNLEALTHKENQQHAAINGAWST